MKKLIEFLISGCWHKYEEVGNEPLKINYPECKTSSFGRRITCKCSKCGKYRIQDLY